jgi:hypothetical protein
MAKIPPIQIYGADDDLREKIAGGSKKMGQSESAFCRFVLKMALRDNEWLWKDVKIPSDTATED